MPDIDPAPDLVCRVLPDVLAIDRAFDYLVPASLASSVERGTIVRVSLRGRRVRGWITEVGVEPETDVAALRAIAKVSSHGPPPDVVDLSTWAGWRWAGPQSAFLRAASPPNAVLEHPATAPPPGAEASRPARDVDVERAARDAQAVPLAVVRWPPTARMAELLRRLVGAAGSTLVVIPDSGRITALADHLEAHGIRAIAFRGDDHAAARTRAWNQARAGNCVVVGGRIAAWAPVPDLAAVVVVDEGDEALKEERTPAWNAREVVCERARRVGGRVTFVTPTPTLEVLAANPVVVRGPHTMERRGWGRIVVVDRSDEEPGSGLLSAELVEHLRHGTPPVVCVLNRKGRARVLACAACREVVRCETCGGAMAEATTEAPTGEPAPGGLECHRCGGTRPRICAACGSTRLARLKPGISRVRDDLARMLPRLEVAEVEAATTDLPGAGVLIGTEAVLHRAGSASVVAFLDFDQELLAPRYRAGEQALWLLVRALRATGHHGDGRVVVQTRVPDHDAIRSALAADPDLLAASDRELRLALRFPPFGALAKADGDIDAVAALVAGLAAAEGVSADGVVAGAPGRGATLVRAAGISTLCNGLARAVPEARARGRVRVEVDPLRV